MSCSGARAASAAKPSCRSTDSHSAATALLRLYLRLIPRAQLILDALAKLSVPAPVDGPQDLAETRVVMRRHRGVELVTVHPVRRHEGKRMLHAAIQTMRSTVFSGA